MTVCVDQVQGLGTFVELERIAPASESRTAVQAELSAVIDSLGIDATRTHETYDSLVRAATEAPLAAAR